MAETTRSVICPTCSEAGEKSTVRDYGTTQTLMGYSQGYYDEGGNYVRHKDPNWRTTQYECSAGHWFQIVRKEGEADRVRPNFSRSCGPCFSPPGEFRVSEGPSHG
jgi:hypothetical protein